VVAPLVKLPVVVAPTSSETDIAKLPTIFAANVALAAPAAPERLFFTLAVKLCKPEAKAVAGVKDQFVDTTVVALPSLVVPS